ncbi:MAG: amidohydrolase family protein [Chryseosolibacter sp.]
MKAILTIVLLGGALNCLSQNTPSTSGRQTVFQDVNVVPMDEEKVLERQDVIIKDGRITAIGPSKKIRYDGDAVVIKARGKYLLPGLAEMHAHVPPNDDVESMKEVLKLFLLNGITTIRGMLGHPKHLELRDAVRRGEVPGPHLYTTGPSFNGMSVKSPEAGAEMVRRQKEAGYDYLKLHPGLTRQKFDAIASTARQVGIPFVGHVSWGVGVWHAIESEYSSIDHLDGFIEGLVPGIEKVPEQEAGLFGMYMADKADRSQVPKLMQALKEKNIWVVPTQSLAERWFHPDFSAADFRKDPHSVYLQPDIKQQWINAKENLVGNPQYDPEEIKAFVQFRRDLILACQKNGVGLLLGCDAPQIFNVPGFSTHHELEYLVRSGLTPYEALLTGTVNVAKYLNKKDAGFVRTGAVSDLILLNANPLTDIKNTSKIEGVMIGDRWMDRAYIEGELKKLVRD